MPVERPIINRQSPEVEEIVFRVVDHTLIPSNQQGAMPEGWTKATVAKGGTGIFVFTLKVPARRTIIVSSVVPVGSTGTVNAQATLSTVTLNFANVAGVATDMNFHMTLFVPRSPWVY